MTPARFRALVGRLEQKAARSPGAYRVHVAILAVLGYVYVFTILTVLIAATVGLILVGRLIVVKLLIPLLVLIYVVLRALWVSVPAPRGERISRFEAPKLHELVRRVRRTVAAPHVHVIQSIPQLNAAVVQVPRLGVFGWYRNYLLVGLPLLQALSPEEWQAVLAHELGHLSGRHGMLGAWIYRVRETWGRLAQSIHARKSALGGLLFGKFFDVYAPYFMAYSFVLARGHEYEADQASAELAGAETARRALLRLEMAGRVSDDFWAQMKRSAATQAEPPTDAFGQLRDKLGGGLPATATSWVSQAWSRPTNYSDTHPALADRLKALGWVSTETAPPPPPEPLQGSTAAATYLGPAETKLQELYDKRWREGVTPEWKKQHEHMSAALRRVTELDARASESLTQTEELERITQCVSLGNLERAGSLAAALLVRAPDLPEAHYYVGRKLLLDGDTRGVEHIERAMRERPEAIGPGCQVLCEFYWQRGEMEQVDRFQEWATTRHQEQHLAEQERGTITNDSRVGPHEWSDELVADLRATLQAFPDLRAAYLCRLLVKHLPEHPCYVLGLVPDRFLESKQKDAALRTAVAQRIKTPLQVRVFVLNTHLKPLRRTMEKIPGAQVK
jgi:Zn-dependent protease with chaperone function